MWAKQTGYAPRATDWKKKPGEMWPASIVVARKFGSFQVFIAELGIEQRPKRSGYSTPKTYNLLDCLIAGMVFVDIYGVIPQQRTWQASGLLPGHSTIALHFGSWSAFQTALAQYK
jgi:hypothetical protein